MSSTPTAVPPAGPWLAHLRREAERFTQVVRQSPLRAHVPTYPDFTVHSLAAHIGRALRLFQGIISTDGPADGAGYQSVQVPAGEEIADWVAAGLDPLLTLLSAVPPDKPVPFPHQAGERPAGLIAPLLAVEVGVHRWDVESVLGEHVPIPADLAVQEVESVFANFVPRLAGSGVADIGGTVWLRTTDTGAAWSARVDDGRLVTERAPDGPCDTAVVAAGAAQDIALLVWKRALPPRPELEVTGAPDVLKRFLATDYIPDPRTTPAH
ncbi:maleylpyruvate isomerase family mycothiol-dependent enzyme [Trebonia sp.]|uniref:maleylpyruvate isomerase family mycothiol-dependent enzyme n=1 Tax=Trebonia sp. TaxID=2767075 RepID=UPI002619C31D|nr:maleylpyruvate isomerase family mycothiol-dependent enzyme [Trebonia sp.]